ncbi:T9SS type A sorting domain-containing protein [Lacinutrix sp. MEBiC02404]
MQGTTLSIIDVELENEINRYPNPVKNILNMKHAYRSIGPAYMYNVLCNLVLSSANSIVVNVSTLNSGIYFVKFK